MYSLFIFALVLALSVLSDYVPSVEFWLARGHHNQGFAATFTLFYILLAGCVVGIGEMIFRRGRKRKIVAGIGLCFNLILAILSFLLLATI